MAAYQPPQQDPATMWAIADHVWSVGFGIGATAIAALAWIIRRIRWADKIANEIKETRYASDTAMRLMQERQMRWETEVSEKLKTIHSEFREDFQAMHNRIDNVLSNK